jgi:hypothetical protein
VDPFFSLPYLKVHPLACSYPFLLVPTFHQPWMVVASHLDLLSLLLGIKDRMLDLSLIDHLPRLEIGGGQTWRLHLDLDLLDLDVGMGRDLWMLHST